MHRVIYAATAENVERLSKALESREAPIELVAVESTGALLDRLASDRGFDAILIDREAPTLGGLRAVQLVGAAGYPAPMLVLAREADAKTADAVMEAGAADFIVRRGGYADAMPRIIREAVESWRAREAVNEMARRKAELDTLLSLQRNLLSAHDLWETFGHVAEQLTADCPYDRLIVWRIEEDEVALASFVAGKDADQLRGERRPLSRTLFPRAFAATKPVISKLNEPNVVPRDMIVCAIAPLIENGQPVGAIEVQNTTMYYGDKHAKFLGAIAEQISVALSLAATRREEIESRYQRSQAVALRDMTLAIARQLEPTMMILSANLALVRDPDSSADRLEHLWQEVDKATESLSRRLRMLRMSAEAGGAQTLRTSTDATARPASGPSPSGALSRPTVS